MRWRRRLPVLGAGTTLGVIILCAALAGHVAPTGPNEPEITRRLTPPAFAGGS